MSSGEANVTIEVRLDEGGVTGQLVVKGERLYDRADARHRYRDEQG